jgi:hypothetical protein
MPTTGICPRCQKPRGHDLRQWTLLPKHMYCKYCFMEEVDDPREREKIKREALKEFRQQDAEGKVVTIDRNAMVYNLLIEIRDMTTLVLQNQKQDSDELFLYKQPAWTLEAQLNPENTDLQQLCLDHVKRRLAITHPVRGTPGRYLAGRELHVFYAGRLEQLMETSPEILLLDINSVTHTPAITAVHESVLRDQAPEWLTKAMSAVSSDYMDWLAFPVTYVQAIAKGLTNDNA